MGSPVKRPRRSWGTLAWLTLASLFLFALAFFSSNKDVGSDPKLTLLVSQAIVEHGTVRLDAYEGDQLLELPFADYVHNSRMILARNGHYYAFFPLGPSVLAVPFVALFNLLGKDMRTFDSFELQIFLAAATVVAVFWLLFLTGRLLVSERAALVIAFIAVAGSSLLSTLGTALWSLNFSTIFISTALFLLVRAEVGRSPRPYLLGLLLFLAYFSRPSAAAFIAPALAFLFWRQRPYFLRTAVTAALLLLAYLLWNRLELGQWLPDYASLARFQEGHAPLWVGVLGNLFSPSRGLFVYSPFFLLVPAGLLLFWRPLRREPLFWLCVAWLGLQLLIVASAVVWWGGVSYGPRLLAEALPGLVLMFFLLWREAGQRLGTASRRRAATAFAALGLLALLIQVNGLYHGATVRWNMVVIAQPNETTGPLGDFFDWRRAQWLASNETVCALEAQKMAAYVVHDKTLIPVGKGEPILARADASKPFNVNYTLAFGPSPLSPSAPIPAAAPRKYALFLPLVLIRDGNLALFAGWEELLPGAAQRRSVCPSAIVFFRLGEWPPERGTLWLSIRASSYGRQPVRVAINDVFVAEIVWPGEPATIIVPFDAALLRPGGLNTITFDFPGAHTWIPSLNYYRFTLEDRHLALALEELRMLAGEPGSVSSPGGAQSRPDPGAILRP